MPANVETMFSVRETGAIIFPDLTFVSLIVLNKSNVIDSFLVISLSETFIDHFATVAVSETFALDVYFAYVLETNIKAANVTNNTSAVNFANLLSFFICIFPPFVRIVYKKNYNKHLRLL